MALVMLVGVNVFPSALVGIWLQSRVKVAVPAGTPVGCALCRSALYVSVVEELVSVTIVLVDESSSWNCCSIRMFFPRLGPVCATMAKVESEGGQAPASRYGPAVVRSIVSPPTVKFSNRLPEVCPVGENSGGGVICTED